MKNKKHESWVGPVFDEIRRRTFAWHGGRCHPARIQLLLTLTCAALTLAGAAEDAKPAKSSDPFGLAEILSFETAQPDTSPAGWGGGPAGTLFVDGKIVHGGRWSARIERGAESSGQFSSLSKSIPMDFTGRQIELRGYLRSEKVSGDFGLWLREDDDSQPLEFVNMQSRNLKGTTDWTEYSILLPINANAKMLVFGFLVSGTGKAWADDLQLLIDGKPVWAAPKAERAKTILDSDHQFDGGSGIAPNDLTKVQIENLAALGKVWGFLKYHHPRVTSGEQHWDYELFRVLPAILAAPDRSRANAALLHWIAGLGEVTACESCAKLEESDIHLRPELDWIDDQALLGKELSQSLRSIHRNRLDGKQFYVSLEPGVGNPKFLHEQSYAGLKLPDAGFQLLSLYRFWNIIEYWSPYRDVLDEDWDLVLSQFIPKIALAKNAETYQRELMALIAKDQDSHANLWSSLQVRPPVGDHQLPVTIRFIENRAVVTSCSVSEAGKATGLEVGDVITDLDGVPVSKLVESWTPYYAAGNDPTRLRDIAGSLTRGNRGTAAVRALRGSKLIEIRIERLPLASLNLKGSETHDLPGETFRLLSDQIAYLKLSTVKASEAAHYVEAAAGTKGLILDIRNYPSEFMVFALGSLLVAKKTEFARFTQGDLANPGAFHWTKPISISTGQPYYSGKLVVLLDESSQSQAEYTSMAFRAAGATVVGSTTAGADGNVSSFALPGGLRSMISGIGIFYPDKKPTQRVGIIPDVEVRPTIAGIRAGRDEVLEEALRQILEPAAATTLIEKLRKR
jgi:C-terminal processing protease CtpA/Prc